MLTYVIIAVVIVAAFVLGSLSADQLLRSRCSEKSLVKFKKTAEYRSYRISFCGGVFFTLFLPLAIVLAALGYTTTTGAITLGVFGICGILLLALAWRQVKANLEHLGLDGSGAKPRKTAHPDAHAIENPNGKKQKSNKNYGKSKKRR